MNPTALDHGEIVDRAYANAFQELFDMLHSNLNAEIQDAEDQFRKKLKALNRAHEAAERIMGEVDKEVDL